MAPFAIKAVAPMTKLGGAIDAFCGMLTTRVPPVAIGVTVPTVAAIPPADATLFPFNDKEPALVSNGAEPLTDKAPENVVFKEFANAGPASVVTVPRGTIAPPPVAMPFAASTVPAVLKPPDASVKVPPRGAITPAVIGFAVPTMTRFPPIVSRDPPETFPEFSNNVPLPVVISPPEIGVTVPPIRIVPPVPRTDPPEFNPPEPSNNVPVPVLMRPPVIGVTVPLTTSPPGKGNGPKPLPLVIVSPKILAVMPLETTKTRLTPLPLTFN